MPLAVSRKLKDVSKLQTSKFTSLHSRGNLASDLSKVSMHSNSALTARKAKDKSQEEEREETSLIRKAGFPKRSKFARSALAII